MGTEKNGGRQAAGGKGKEHEKGEGRTGYLA